MEPVSITMAVISLVGTIILAIINLFKNPIDCNGLQSKCCLLEGDVDVTGNNNKVNQ